MHSKSIGCFNATYQESYQAFRGPAGARRRCHPTPMTSLGGLCLELLSGKGLESAFLEGIGHGTRDHPTGRQHIVCFPFAP